MKVAVTLAATGSPMMALSVSPSLVPMKKPIILANMTKAAVISIFRFFLMHRMAISAIVRNVSSGSSPRSKSPRTRAATACARAKPNMIRLLILVSFFTVWSYRLQFRKIP